MFLKSLHVQFFFLRRINQSMLINFFNMNLSCKIAPLCNVMRSCLYQKFVFGPKNFTLIQKKFRTNTFFGPEIFMHPKFFRTKYRGPNKIWVTYGSYSVLRISRVVIIGKIYK